MAEKLKCYFATSTTGGGTGALDSIDGSLLNDDDKAIVFDYENSIFRPYSLDEDSGTAESDPDVIAPDSNADDKRWHRLSLTTETLTGLGVSAFMQTVLDDADATNALTTLGFSTFIKTLIDDTTAAAARATLGVYPAVPTKFTYTDSNTITLRPARYYHVGTTSQYVSWASDLAFDFGSGGSNGESSDLATDTWYGLYIDDSAVVSAGTGTITVAQLINSTTIPSWSDAKHGWYNGNDLCIGVFKTAASAAELIAFNHVQSGMIEWTENIGIHSAAGVSTTWVTLNPLLLPSCCSAAHCTFYIWGSSTESATYYYRSLGSSDTTGKTIDTRGEHNIYGHTHMYVVVGTGGDHPYIQIRSNKNVSGDALSLNQSGYALPIGMY